MLGAQNEKKIEKEEETSPIPLDSLDEECKGENEEKLIVEDPQTVSIESVEEK